MDDKMDKLLHSFAAFKQTHKEQHQEVCWRKQRVCSLKKSAF